jgi:hypothetical protein
MRNFALASMPTARATGDAALDDLREALLGLIEEFGVHRKLSIILAA